MNKNKISEMDSESMNLKEVFVWFSKKREAGTLTQNDITAVIEFLIMTELSNETEIKDEKV